MRWGNLLHKFQLVWKHFEAFCLTFTISLGCFRDRAYLDPSELDLCRFEAQQCCVQNHGFLAEPASQEEHDMIKQHLVISKLHHIH